MSENNLDKIAESNRKLEKKTDPWQAAFYIMIVLLLGVIFLGLWLW